MIDIAYIREHPDLVRANLAKRKVPDYLVFLETVLKLDEQWRSLKGKIDNARARRNKVSAEINLAKKAGKDATAIIAEAAEIPKIIAEAEKQLTELEANIKTCMYKIPNLMHDSVPYGKDDTENQVIKEFGTKPTFDFTPKSHVDLLAENDWADLERATKIAGSRWYFLKGDLAILEMALTRYAIDFLRAKDFTLVVPPFMMAKTPYEGVTSLGDFQEALYKIDNDDLFAISTSEHPLTAMHMDETLDEKQLPLKLVGYSACFRKEAGAHGKDQKGIFRVHQFNKVEQVILCKKEDSWQWHEKIVQNAEEFFTSLGLHFRKVNICTGDLGIVAAKKYDLEAWYPVQNAYREVVSGSNCTTYQSLRLNIKYTSGKEKQHVHTLNSTCVATTRALVAILENFQNKDGSVNVPSVLHKYTGFKVLGAK